MSHSASSFKEKDEKYLSESDVNIYVGEDVDTPQIGVDTEAVGERDETKIDVNTKVYDGVQRRMKQRHMQMISMAGVMGTGLFLGTGKAIAHGGPAGALLAFLTVGSITWTMMQCLGEMTVFAPISGGYVHQVDRYVDGSLSFALGWTNLIGSFVSLPSEVVSASILISFWDNEFTVAHQAAYLVTIIVLAAGLNLMGVKYYGESEFIFCLIKIFLIVGLIIGGLVIDLGGGPNHDRLGFRYWQSPGAFTPFFTPGAKGHFLGWFTTLLQAAYSFNGMQSISFSAAEVENPRKSVVKAVKRIFYRILLFYIAGIIVIGMLIPYDEPRLLQSTGNAADSPFVIAFNRAGVKVLPHIINGGVLTSAFSATSDGLYSGSRNLYGLSVRGHAPRIFARTSQNGVPYIAIISVISFGGLSFMSLSAGASTVLNYLTNLTALIAFITWGCIAIAYLQFRTGLDKQGIDRATFYWRSPAGRAGAWYTLFWAAVITIFSGWKVFTKGNFNAKDFVLSYITIVIVLSLFFGHKIIKRTRFKKPEDIDFVSNIPTEAEVGFDQPPPKTMVGKVASFLFT